MNTKTLIGVAVVVIIAILFFAFGRGDKKTTEETAMPQPETTSGTTAVSLKDGNYTVVKEESSLQWEGKRPLIPNYNDRGTLALQSGSFVVTNGAVGQGTLVFDMNSITAVSTGKGDGQDRLTGHLKSADFFDVAKFPTAELKVRDAVSSDGVNFIIRGDLTIKGKTNPVEIPATLANKDGKIEVRGEISLDRTLWEVKYGSGKFFDNLANNVIDDMFKVSFTLVAQGS